MATARRRLSLRPRRTLGAGVVLAVMVAAVAMAPAVVAVDDSTEPVQEIKQAVDDVLSRPAYTGISESSITRLLRENPVSRWFLEQFQRFVDWVNGLGGDRNTSVPTTQRDPNRPSAGLLIVVLAAVLVGFIVYRLARTREDAERAAAMRAASAADASGGEIERLADEAEARGDYEGAVRLRCEAGLRRLDETGSVEYDPSMRTGSVRTALAMHEFDSVATQFEVSAYSEQKTFATDAAAARTGWSEVLRILRPKVIEYGEAEGDESS